MLVVRQIFARLRVALKVHRPWLIGAVAFVFILTFASSVYAIPSAGDVTGIVTDGISSAARNMVPMMIAGLGAVFGAIAWGLGKLLIIVITMVIVPVLGYNNFGQSNVVNIGWALVRDIVNMFVIVILLYIAVTTILGVAKAPWQQQLPKFFIAIVAVNFSKTITLLAIDIGQVVMFTFVNALRDVAAGNFINLFNISSFFDISDAATTAAAGKTGFEAFGYLATMQLTASLLAMVLAIILLMAFIFIYRIVVLWILLIISPAAFFSAGLQGFSGAMAKPWSEWVSKLIGAISLGPILAFFLWLALASASSGAIAESENFPTLAPSTEEADAVSLYSAAFEVDKLTSLFVAMVLLMVGFQVASSQAGALGGPAAKYVTKEGGQKLFKGIIGAPAAAAYAGGRLAKRGAVGAGRLAVGAGAAGAAGGIRLAKTGAYEAFRQGERRTGKISEGARAVTAHGASLRQAEGKGVIGGATAGAKRLLGGALLAAGGRGESLLAAQRKAERSNVEKKVGDYSDSQRYGEYDALGTSEPIRLDQQDARSILATKLATDKNEQKNYKKYLTTSLGEEEGGKAYDERIKQVTNFIDGNKDEMLGDDKKKKDAFFKAKTGNMHMLDDSGGKTKEEKIRSHLTDEDYKSSQLSVNAVKDPEVERIMRDQVVETYKDKDGVEQTVSAWDKARSSKGTPAAVRNYMDEQNSARARDVNQMGASTIAENIASPTNPLQVENINVENLNQNDQVAPGLIDAAANGADMSGMQAPVKEAVVAAIATKRAEAQDNPSEDRRLRIAEFKISGNMEAIGVSKDGDIAPDQRITVEQVIKQDPNSIGQMAGAVGDDADDLTEVIKQSVNDSQMDKIMQTFSDATTKAAQEQARTTIKTIQKALDVEISQIQNEMAATGATRSEELNRTKSKKRKADLVHRNMGG